MVYVRTQGHPIAYHPGRCDMLHPDYAPPGLYVLVPLAQAKAMGLKCCGKCR